MKTRILRKVHRWLGLFIGIQFLCWTAGGLYFSWIDLDEVHGDDLSKPLPPLNKDISLVSPSISLSTLDEETGIASISQIRLVNLLGKPLYRIEYMTEQREGTESKRRVVLADAETGIIRTPLSKSEAQDVALTQYGGEGKIETVDLIDEKGVGKHHEYRGSPTPAFAVSFDDSRRTRIYVAQDYGIVTSFRNSKWRIFDWLWMLHTMDYSGRDNFNNRLLKVFSIFGMVTILSGFTLFFASSTYFKRRTR